MKLLLKYFLISSAGFWRAKQKRPSRLWHTVAQISLALVLLLSYRERQNLRQTAKLKGPRGSQQVGFQARPPTGLCFGHPSDLSCFNLADDIVSCVCFFGWFWVVCMVHLHSIQICILHSKLDIFIWPSSSAVRFGAHITSLDYFSKMLQHPVY